MEFISSISRVVEIGFEDSGNRVSKVLFFKIEASRIGSTLEVVEFRSSFSKVSENGVEVS